MQVYIYYPNSKEVLTQFISPIHRTLQEEDRLFFAQVLGSKLEELLFDFGHVGRAYSDFHIATLIVDHAKVSDYEQLECVLSFSTLLSELAAQFENFLDSHYNKREDLFTKELAALRLLAKQVRDQRINVTLKLEEGNVYSIIQISSVS